MNTYKGTQAETLAAQFPNVPQMMTDARHKEIVQARKESLDEAKELIYFASLEELRDLSEPIFERWLSITGCAPKMEDALCELDEHIAIGDHGDNAQRALKTMRWLQQQVAKLEHDLANEKAATKMLSYQLEQLRHKIELELKI